MSQLSGAAVKMLAQQLYGYNMSDDAAEAVAHMVGGLTTYERRLEALNLAGLQPPFGYLTLLTQAEQQRRNPK
jgi:hypothetical protein